MATTTLYELAVIYQIGDQGASSKVAELLKRAGGQISRETTWEERDLAYPIKRQTRGVYTFYELDLPAPAISQLENSLNITEGVLRHLITKIDHRGQAQAATVAQRLADRQSGSPNKAEGGGKPSQLEKAKTT